ncbi:MAG: hypothetical protein NT010_03710 [Proteobacteria bacterium]|nr:hypothetical protein [Pseudomonadota bacterium]
MGKLYIDKRYFADSKTRWVSFETDARLKRTKKDIYGKCVPCIMNLYEQLMAGKTEIELGSAYNCWKIVVLMKDLDECTRFLSEFEKDMPEDMYIKGRFGSGDANKNTKVIVFNTENETEKNLLYDALKACAAQIKPEPQVIYHKACADLYHELLGNWRQWSETAPIKNPDMIKPIVDRIRKVLYWEKEDLPTDQEKGA